MPTIVGGDYMGLKEDVKCQAGTLVWVEGLKFADDCPYFLARFF